VLPDQVTVTVGEDACAFRPEAVPMMASYVWLPDRRQTQVEQLDPRAQDATTAPVLTSMTSIA
jgi:hypothetical protein